MTHHTKIGSILFLLCRTTSKSVVRHKIHNTSIGLCKQTITQVNAVATGLAPEPGSYIKQNGSTSRKTGPKLSRFLRKTYTCLSD
jgi:hypothetical protein